MLFTLVVIGAGILMIAAEVRWPGRSWPRVRGWWARAAFLNALQAILIVLTGHLLEQWFVRHRLWSADRLGIVGGALVGYLVHTFVYYWWHRARHASPLLWRWVHQVHHSPQRIEIITSFYKHPLEIILNSVISSAVVYLVVGLSPATVSVVMLLNGLAELLYHWNVPTPFWLGFFIQRPESHCVHHQEGLHSYNFADLPIFDMLFGTFRNPRSWQSTTVGRCGFGPGVETRLGTLLMGVDLSSPDVGRR